MVCEMEMEMDPIEEDEDEEEDETEEEMDIEAVPSMWPEDIGDDPGKQFNIESGGEQDMLEQVTIPEKQTVVDFQWLSQLTNFTDKGSAQLAHLVKRWEYKQANVVRLLKEEIDSLSRQRHESELKELEILEEHRFEEKPYVGDDKRQISLEDIYDIFKEVPAITRNNKGNNNVAQKRLVEIEAAEFDTVMYWKQRAMSLEKLLEASIQREQILKEKLHDSINNLERESSPVEDLNQLLHRADNFLHFILQHAPIVIGHQDKELRYRFIYNHFPSLHEEDIIGKTDVEIFTGAGVKENQEFKREVLEKGLPAKREVTFETELFGSKTFLIYVEPVSNKAGEIIGINYVGMEVTDQVKKREKMVKLREEVAVQKAKETELNKTIHITEETMRAKQMLATMSHEIRSPLSGVVSMTEILATTKLDREQRQLLDVMLSSGDLVLQLINDILDLSKVESGVMKLEATKFRPREVVKHVLQTAAASLKKSLTLQGHISDEVPIEVIGDVLRIRQILTNLISNAIKFTHQGKVGIKLYVVPQPPPFRVIKGDQQDSFHHQRSNSDQYSGLLNVDQKHSSTTHHHHPNPHKQLVVSPAETTVWIRCDVYDTGIGIPENALPTLFTKYMQVSADHARKYGGTGLGLAICKQLVELMGGRLTVSSNVNVGSTFTFVLPYNVSPMCDSSYDDIEEEGIPNKAEDDITAGYFKFQPRTLGFSSNGKTRSSLDMLPLKLSVEEDDPSSYMFPTDNLRQPRTACSEDACCVIDVVSDGMSESECSPSQSQSQSPIPSPCNNKDDVVLKVCAEDDETANKVNSKVEKAPPELSSSSSSSSSKLGGGGGGENVRLLDLEKAGPRILLVEDNKINVMVTQSMMKQFGQEMDVVNNGVEAVRAVQRSDYDLVLMDVCMPIMDGLQATRLIRSFEETGSWDEAAKAGIESPLSSTSIPCSSRKRLPIIAMTANALSESADECFMNGMDSFVSKPVTFLKLKQCLDQYLP